MIYFTSSWDDGSPYDLKLAELLLKHSQNATFFIPLRNNNRPVIDEKQINHISKNFEVGAHTVGHKYLTNVTDIEAEYEIKQSKAGLEEITGKPVHGFCFPGGKFRETHLKIVKESGFSYARTTNMFKVVTSDFLMDTTLQAYNHKKFTYLFHLMKRGYITQILKNSILISRSPGWDQLISQIIRRIIKEDTTDKTFVIHLWGHSHDLENNGSWLQLEKVLNLVNSSGIPSKTNFEISGIRSRNER